MLDHCRTSEGDFVEVNPASTNLLPKVAQKIWPTTERNKKAFSVVAGLIASINVLPQPNQPPTRVPVQNLCSYPLNEPFHLLGGTLI